MNERELLEKAARACGYNVEGIYQDDDGVTWLQLNPRPSERVGWSSLADSGDCAEMNAQLMIDTEWYQSFVLCRDYSNEIAVDAIYATHGVRSAAWRYASTVVAGMMGERK